MHVDGANDYFGFVSHAFKTVRLHELFLARGAPVTLFGGAFSFSFSILDCLAGFTEDALHDITGLNHVRVEYKSFVNYTISPPVRTGDSAKKIAN